MGAYKLRTNFYSIPKIEKGIVNVKLKEILFEIHNLKFYSPEEQHEYISYFSQKEEILRYITEQTRQTKNRILSRIKEGKGVTPIATDTSISNKITTSSHLSALRTTEKITLGIVSGCYDLLHLGHLRGLAYAKQLLERYPNPVLCALTLSDENIRIKKGDSRPILNLNERLEMICGVACVDYVIPLEEPNCLAVLETVKPDYFFKAERDTEQDIVRQEIGLVESSGGKVVVFPPDSGRSISTTEMIEAIGSESSAG